MKIALAEGTGRWHLASGSTIFAGWRTLGRWTTVYFAIYVMVWGFVYGAAAMTSTALPLAALFGGELKLWAIGSGLAGLLFIGLGRYGIFEKVTAALVGIMFVTVVGLAVLTLPDVGEAVTGLVPTLPDGSVIYTLGLIGGVGGTITMAAYGYWINAKGWRDSSWMRVMRLDNSVAYVMTGVFVIAMLIVGAELLFSANIALTVGDRGLLDLDAVLRDRFGDVIGTAFLVGFWATSFSSILGVWNGVSLMSADFVDNVQGIERLPDDDSTKRPAFRFYRLWLTFPPIALLFLDQPFGLVVAYGALGSLFLPFLAGTLLRLLNSERVPREHHSGWASNGTLVVATGAVRRPRRVPDRRPVLIGPRSRVGCAKRGRAACYGWSFSPRASISTNWVIRRARVSGRLATWIRCSTAYRLDLSNVAQNAVAAGLASRAFCRSGGTVARLGES